MDNKGLRVVGKNAGDRTPGPEPDAELGATGFYYITPADAWDDTTLSGKRVYSRLITLPGYILRELLKAVVLSAAVFSIILMAVFAGQVMKDGIGPYTLARVLPNFIPLICPFVMPLAIITGILICYSRLAKDNEILAAYAGGINPFWLMLPALLTSVIAIFITLTLNEVALMPAIRNIERLVIDDQANILRRMIARPGNITVQTGSEYIAMSKLDPSRDPLERATLDITRFNSISPGLAGDDFAWDTRYPFPAKRVIARDHMVEDFSEGKDEGSGGDLTMRMLVTKPIFQDLHVGDINRTFIAYGESGEERLVLGGRPDVTIHANRTTFWPILMLSDTRREAEEKVRELSAINLDDLTETQRAAAVSMLDRQQSLIQHRTSEINMRLALCFSCLAFAVLGIPLGMRTRGTLVASFVWGIVVAGAYFLALKSAEAQVAQGFLSYWIIWIPDVVVAVLGFVMWFVSSRRV
ncbi:MAG: LptF/LptG family permease [Planctomycetota bacterium]|jgi:lipopolysaccharide export LptBFGC system permease protein LptF|nr:LptF/LptG family permease [Planctomycetota bacterium]